MEEQRRRSKNAGRVCERLRIILRTIDTKTQIGTKKERKPPTKIRIKKEMKCKNEKQNVTKKEDSVDRKGIMIHIFVNETSIT
jgi:hypothetical protein